MRQSFYIVFLLTLIVGCRTNSDLPSLAESYNYEDAKPFGTKTAHYIIGSLYPDNDLELLEKPLEKQYQLIDNSHSLLIIITKSLVLSKPDLRRLIDFLDDGNFVFISSEKIDTNLLRQVQISQFTPIWQDEEMGDQALQLDSSISANQLFGYFYKPFESFFIKDENEYATSLGKLYNSGQPNTITFKVGKGQLILNSSPQSMSNYFLLTKNNYDYLNKIIARLPENLENIYWDNYYTSHFGNSGDDWSTLRVIKKYPALYRAFLLAALMLCLYILFYSKRRQKVVPVIKPNQNSSIKFAEAIAGLYKRNNDNKDIASKMTTYFLDHIRSRYYLQTNQPNQEFLHTLSRKSGYAEEKVVQLFQVINSVEKKSKVSDDELLHLNKLIQQFPKN